MIILLLINGLFAPSLSYAEEVNDDVDGINDQELEENDYILYFVNVGTPTPDLVEDNDKIGLFASSTEQMYGEDLVTGKKWGLVTETTSVSVQDPTNKYGSLRYYNGEQKRDKAIEYKFELPEGFYDITVGFKNPWSGRSVNIIAEDENLSGDYSIGEYGEEKEETFYQVPVTDGELDLRIQGPSEADLTNYNDPLINYIIIRENIIIPYSDLEDIIEMAEIQLEKEDVYTPYSLEVLVQRIEEAHAVVELIQKNDGDVTLFQDEIRTTIRHLQEAIEGLVENVSYDSFKPGEVWLDTNGAPIQAHGGGMMYDEKTETYYWYGEDKTHGYLPARGVR